MTALTAGCMTALVVVCMMALVVGCTMDQAAASTEDQAADSTTDQAGIYTEDQAEASIKVLAAGFTLVQMNIVLTAHHCRSLRTFLNDGVTLARLI